MKSLEEVLDSINAAEASGGQKVTAQPAPGSEGLVFEYDKPPVTEATAYAPVQNETIKPSVNKPSTVESEISNANAGRLEVKETVNETKKIVKIEGNVSEAPTRQASASAEVGSQTEAGAVSDGGIPSSIWSTYVPRFTDVSEKYRLKGDKRFRDKIDSLKDAEDGEETAVAPDIDPTAEIEENSEAVPVIRPERNDVSEKVASINVYKFSGVEDFVEEINGVTAEDEAKKIEELLARPAQAVPPIALEPAAESPESKEQEMVSVDGSADSVSVEQKSESLAVDLPDPDHKDIRVIDYTDRIKPTDEQEDAPSGVEESVTSTRDENGYVISAEFTNPIQRDNFKDKFLDSLMSIRLRFGVAVIFAIGILVLEILAMTGVVSPTLSFDEKFNFALAGLDYLLAGGMLVLALPEVARATVYLVEGKFMPDMMSLVGYLVLTFYTLGVMLSRSADYPLFGFLFAIITLCSISAAKYRKRADFLSFKVISQNEEKQILDKRPTRELQMENLALDGMIDEYSSRIVRTFRTSFISDFFANSSDVSNVPSTSLLVLCITLGFGILAALIAGLLTKDLLLASELFTLSFLLGMPTFSLLSSKLSFYQSQRAAVLEESAAVGEGAFYEFAATDVVAFDDTDIFGPEDVNLKRFMLYGDRDNMEKAMRQMCALFAVVGGPLDFMFTNAIDNRVRHKSATNTVIEDDGLSGDVMGHRISAGSREYMIRNGIEIPEAARPSDSASDTTKVLYAAEDGEVYAKFYIRYSFSEEFTSLLPSLKEQGIIPLIYTRDPNITNELLDTLTAGADCMRVVKIYRPIREETVYGRVSARMVTFGDKLNAIVMILLSKKYRAFTEKIRFTELLATFVGLVLAVVFGILGVNPAAVIASALWQIVWCIVLHYMSISTFLREEKNKNNEE